MDTSPAPRTPSGSRTRPTLFGTPRTDPSNKRTLPASTGLRAEKRRRTVAVKPKEFTKALRAAAEEDDTIELPRRNFSVVPPARRTKSPRVTPRQRTKRPHRVSPSEMLRNLSRLLSSSENVTPQVPQTPSKPSSQETFQTPTHTGKENMEAQTPFKTPAAVSSTTSLLIEERRKKLQLSVRKSNRARDVRDLRTPSNMLRMLSRMPGFKVTTPETPVRSGRETRAKSTQREEIQSDIHLETHDNEATFQNGDEEPQNEAEFDLQEVHTTYEGPEMTNEGAYEEAYALPQDMEFREVGQEPQADIAFDADDLPEPDNEFGLETEHADETELLQQPLPFPDDNPEPEDEFDVHDIQDAGNEYDAEDMPPSDVDEGYDDDEIDDLAVGDALHRESVERRKSTRLSEAGIPVPNLPNTLVKSIFSTFCRSKVSKDAFEAVADASHLFFEQLSGDLEAYAKHANRRMINESDVTMLMRRQRLLGEKHSLEYMAQRYLPRELSDQITSSALAGNVVWPQLKKT